MGLLTRAVSNVRRDLRAGEWGNGSSIPPNSSLGGVSSVGSNSATVAGALAISTVMNCVKALHDDFTVLPFDGYRGDRRGVRQTVRTQPQIVAQPFGPAIPRRVGIGQNIVSLALRGNTYNRVLEVDDMGYPTMLQVLNPDKVQVDVIGGLKKYRINHGSWLGDDDVKHIMGFSLPGMLTGLDPVTLQRMTIELAGDVTAYGAQFFRNGASPSGVISVKSPGTVKNAREVKAAWEAGNGGIPNAHRPAVLFGGATWTQLSVTPDNAQFLATREFMREEICGWFGVPLQRVQIIAQHASQGGGKGMEAIDSGYVTHTLLGYATALEETWDPMIPGNSRTWSAFDFDSFLRTDAQTRAAIAQIHRLIGTRNRNELRAQDGLPPIPGPDGEDYNLPFNTNSHVPPLVEPGVDDSLPAPATDPTATPNGGQA